MRLELTGRHVHITPVLRRLVDGKLAKLERLLNSSALSAQAVLSVAKHVRRADITLHARGDKFLHAFGAADTWETSVTEAIDKISQQAHRVKGKWEARKRRGATKSTRAAVSPAVASPARPAGAARRNGAVRMPRIMRVARQAVKAMSVADAARQIDAERDGVVVFRDVETDAVTVLYRRPNGELTLLETEG